MISTNQISFIVKDNTPSSITQFLANFLKHSREILLAGLTTRTQFNFQINPPTKIRTTLNLLPVTMSMECEDQDLLILPIASKLQDLLILNLVTSLKNMVHPVLKTPYLLTLMYMIMGLKNNSVMNTIISKVTMMKKVNVLSKKELLQKHLLRMDTDCK